MKYVEMYKCDGAEYMEKIVHAHNVKSEIMQGWRISRLSKVSPKTVYKKWKNAIESMSN